MTDDVATAVEDVNVIVLANRDPEFAAIEEIPGEGQVVIDLSWAVPGRLSGYWYQGICW